MVGGEKPEVRSEVIHETGFDNTLYYFGCERKTPDWPVVGEFIFIESGFLKEWHDDIFP